MTDDSFEGPRLDAGRHGRRARNMVILTVLAFFAMLIGLVWYQLAQPTPVGQGAAAAPSTDGAPAEPPATP